MVYNFIGKSRITLRGGEKVGVEVQFRGVSHPGGTNTCKNFILIRVKTGYSYSICREDICDV